MRRGNADDSPAKRAVRVYACDAGDWTWCCKSVSSQRNRSSELKVDRECLSDLQLELSMVIALTPGACVGVHMVDQ